MEGRLGVGGLPGVRGLGLLVWGLLVWALRLLVRGLRLLVRGLVLCAVPLAAIWLACVGTSGMGVWGRRRPGESMGIVGLLRLMWIRIAHTASLVF